MVYNTLPILFFTLIKIKTILIKMFGLFVENRFQINLSCFKHLICFRALFKPSLVFFFPKRMLQEIEGKKCGGEEKKSSWPISPVAQQPALLCSSSSSS
jgi:hypothetical protein